MPTAMKAVRIRFLCFHTPDLTENKVKMLERQIPLVFTPKLSKINRFSQDKSVFWLFQPVCHNLKRKSKETLARSKQKLVILMLAIVHKPFSQNHRLATHSKSGLRALVNEQRLTVRNEISHPLYTGELFFHFVPLSISALGIGSAISLDFDRAATDTLGLWFSMLN
jgi:hypothetical protein